MREVHLSGERIVFFNCRDLFQQLHPCLVIPEAQLQEQITAIKTDGAAAAAAASTTRVVHLGRPTCHAISGQRGWVN